MACEKEYHRIRLKSQRTRKKNSPFKTKAVYTFPFPDGERIAVGPFASVDSAQKALERRWKVFYGISFNPKFLPLFDSREESYYEWDE